MTHQAATGLDAPRIYHAQAFVIEPPRLHSARRERVKILTERIDALLAEAQQMDIGIEEVIELLRERDEAMGTKKT